MVFLSVPVAKQPPGWAENRREFARRKKTLLQKRRFWEILVIAMYEKIPGFGRYAARLPGGLFICGLR
jgi:hypothetical protein